MGLKRMLKKMTNLLSDEAYLRLRYFLAFRKPLNLRDPKTFNEKLQWLKLHNRRPEYTRMVDKYEMKGYVAERLGEEYVVPALGVWDRFEDIDFDALPREFVLKCTHDSGGLVICRDKETLDKAAARKKLKQSLKNNYYWDYREWPYKDVKPRILAERFLKEGDKPSPVDYKVLCFHGEAKLIELHMGRFEAHTQDFYDRDWNKLPIGQIGAMNSETEIPRPQMLEEMLRMSEFLAKDIPHIRVDWYWVEGRLYVGELTFFDGSGLYPFTDEKYDFLLGSWIRLPEPETRKPGGIAWAGSIKRAIKFVSRVLPDSVYLRLRYFLAFRKPLDLGDPKTFNEKIQWLKLYDRDPVYPQMVDKYAAKELVSAAIGEEYVIGALGIWEDFSQIDFEKLPEQFVLKTTHDCGGVAVCRDKTELAVKTDSGWVLTPKGKAVRRRLSRHLKENYYYQSREWPYKTVPPRILAESYIENPGQACLVVYKVLCFGGEPEVIQVIQDDKTDKESIDYFDCEWNLLPLRQNYPNSAQHMEKPPVLDKMLALSRILANGRPFIRIDWYLLGEKLLFSEYTLYSDAGMAPFTPESWDIVLGQKLILPK